MFSIFIYLFLVTKQSVFFFCLINLLVNEQISYVYL